MSSETQKFVEGVAAQTNAARVALRELQLNHEKRTARIQGELQKAAKRKRVDLSPHDTSSHVCTQCAVWWIIESRLFEL